MSDDCVADGMERAGLNPGTRVVGPALPAVVPPSMKAPAPTLATLMKSRRGNVVDVSPSPAMLAGAETGGTEWSESVMIQWQEEGTRDYGVVRSRNQTNAPPENDVLETLAAACSRGIIETTFQHR